MEIHEIYLNKLFSREELYKESASKLGCGSISGKDELMATLVGCLMSPVSALVATLSEIAEKKQAA